MHDDRVHVFDLLLDKFRQQHHVPAVGGSIVEASGRHICRVAGVRRRGSRDGIQLSDKWHLGSCTKSISASVWARLVELGCASWTDRIADIFEDKISVDLEWKNVLVRDVLQCRAGLPPDLSRSVFRSSWTDMRPLEQQRLDVVAEFLQYPPKGLGRFVYSNVSYMIVGSAIDRVAGISFEDALEQHLLYPLGIRSAGFGAPEDNFGHRPRVCLAGLRLVRGFPTDPDHIASDNPQVLSSAGTLHLSLEDWSRLIRIFLSDNGTNLLDERSLGKIFQPSSPSYPMVMGWMQWVGSRNFSFLMQGSNTLWSATAALSKDRRRGALVVCNDGRSRVLRECIPLARKLLSL